MSWKRPLDFIVSFKDVAQTTIHNFNPTSKTLLDVRCTLAACKKNIVDKESRYLKDLTAECIKEKKKTNTLFIASYNIKFIGPDVCLNTTYQTVI